MSDEIRYALAESVCVEPLVGRWLAWPHVMSPVTQSLHLLNYQITTLDSYLANPGIHETSCRNPKLLGGAFVDVPTSRLAEVRDFSAKMKDDFSDNLAFARALIAFHKRLVNEANGESLEGYYRRIPEPLRGYVELLYDYYNRPIVRPLEGLLYKSGYYKKEAQSLRLFRQETDLERPYYMSTPRLPGDDSLDWNVAFDDPKIDELFRLEQEPKSFAEIRSLLDSPTSQDAKLRAILRESDGAIRAPWSSDRIRIRYFGHACVLVESGGVSILVDPLIAPRPERHDVERFSFGDLPERIDYVLITHGHHDHFVIETLLRLRRKIGTLVAPRNSGVFYGDLSLTLLARQLGFSNVREVDCLDEFAIPNGRIVAVPFLGEHNDLPSAKTAYFLHLGTRSLLFAADSNCLDSEIYAHLLRETGPIDTLFVGMECVGAPLNWVYGPILPNKPDHRHSQGRRSNGCNSNTALELARAVRCRQAFIYAVGREPWVRYLLALTPAEDDVYMAEIAKYIRSLNDEMGVGANLLFGRAEILI
ncbi:MBL fold metallo-hydrolase [Methylosinus sporium]|uniref:MBL fold metallo-hydrolase n=1 Tax=Methylosinus sporium TaxID=428 RepID=UPI003839EB29